MGVLAERGGQSCRVSPVSPIQKPLREVEVINWPRLQGCRPPILGPPSVMQRLLWQIGHPPNGVRSMDNPTLTCDLWSPDRTPKREAPSPPKMSSISQNAPLITENGTAPSPGRSENADPTALHPQHPGSVGPGHFRHGSPVTFRMFQSARKLFICLFASLDHC